MGLQGRYDDALAVLDSIQIRDAEVAVRVQLERGRVINSSGHPQRAMPSFRMSFEKASARGFEHLAIDALHMLAIVSPREVQDALNNKALELADAARDPRARQWRGSLLNNMGWSAFERGDLDVALARFDAALDARLEQGKQSEIFVARWCVARCLRAMGRVDQALAIQLELAEAQRAARSSDSYVDEEIAACRAALQSGQD